MDVGYKDQVEYCRFLRFHGEPQVVYVPKAQYGNILLNYTPIHRVGKTMDHDIFRRYITQDDYLVMEGHTYFLNGNDKVEVLLCSQESYMVCVKFCDPSNDGRLPMKLVKPYMLYEKSLT